MKRKAVVVCGPTASGKTGLSDEVSAQLSEHVACWTPTLVVDSMQVYREIPVITNQERDRQAELVGITSVVDEWTMARHRFAVEEVLQQTEGPFVLDAGTGMYLNAILLDIDVAPKVPQQVRREAEIASCNSTNPRRAARKRELEISGAPSRGSIWSGALRYDVTLIYLRPYRETLDSSISVRSRRIVRAGREEAEDLKDLVDRSVPPNPSVSSSIGVRELVDVASGALSLDEAESQISARTRKLARRQIRWFDKLTRTLHSRAKISVVHNVEEVAPLNSMIDIISS